MPRVGIDEVRLGQVLVNLLLNAAQAIAPGNMAESQVLEGHGLLGLSSCNGILTSVGGRLQVESQVGVGSLFRVILPVSAHETNPASVAIGATAERRGRILVIDDDAMVRGVIARILQDHDAVCVASAHEALRLCTTVSVSTSS